MAGVRSWQAFLLYIVRGGAELFAWYIAGIGYIYIYRRHRSTCSRAIASTICKLSLLFPRWRGDERTREAYFSEHRHRGTGA